MASKPFFMVFVEGERTPTFKHADIGSAEAEAKRLSKLLNKKAYILIVLKSLQFSEFIEELFYEKEDDLPF